MSALRIVLLVLALAAVAFAARYALTSAANEVAGPSGGERSAPARQLDNVRQKARAIEGELQRRAEQGAKPAEDGAQ